MISTLRANNANKKQVFSACKVPLCVSAQRDGAGVGAEAGFARCSEGVWGRSPH